MTCPCDAPVVPSSRDIAPGLPVLPRVIGDFSAFRASMLAGVRRWPALDAWRARSRDDLGVMVLEFWAYVADVVAFYDQVHANESYLRTAVQVRSLNRIIGLLGYQPRPATAATALLAVLAEGRAAVSVPVATGFRSGAFGAEAPQVFENEVVASAHPLANRWTIKAPRYPQLAQGGGLYREAWLDCEPSGLDLEQDDLALVRAGGAVSGVHRVSEVSAITAADGTPLMRVAFTDEVSLAKSTLVRAIDVLKPTAQTGLWIEVPNPALIAQVVLAVEAIAQAHQAPAAMQVRAAPRAAVQDAQLAQTNAGASAGIDAQLSAELIDNTSVIALERLQPGIRAGDTVIVSKGDDHRWFTIAASRTVSKIVRHAETVVQPAGSTAQDYVIPAVTTRTTELVLDASMNSTARRGANAPWSVAHDAEAITVRFALMRAARVAAPVRMAIWPDQALDLQPGPRAVVNMPPDATSARRYVLEDEGGRAYAIKGSLDPQAGRFVFEESAQWPAPLVPPVTLYGNVLDVRRGETVAAQVLGSGDRAQAGQFFEMAKAPHTYLPDTAGASARGYRSTATVWVDGIEWREIEDFVTAGPEDAVYVLRQNDAGATEVATEVVFGDGVNGRRLPTGNGNVLARYRHGAGAAAPPARSIAQLARPLAGVASVLNPIAAGGGADAESRDEVRGNAPALALLLGRIVSIDDVRAVAAAWPGVFAVRADWRWHTQRQSALVHVDCITDHADLGALHAKIRNLSEPGLQVTVAEALAVPLRLSLSIELDRRFVPDDVLAAVRARLLDAQHGMLAPANIGIGSTLFRSRMHAETLAVPGTIALSALLADGAPFVAMGLDPGAGRWFDVAAGGLVLNAQEEDGDGQ